MACRPKSRLPGCPCPDARPSSWGTRSAFTPASCVSSGTDSGPGGSCAGEGKPDLQWDGGHVPAPAQQGAVHAVHRHSGSAVESDSGCSALRGGACTGGRARLLTHADQLQRAPDVWSSSAWMMVLPRASLRALPACTHVLLLVRQCYGQRGHEPDNVSAAKLVRHPTAST